MPKPTRKATPLWREFEELVARIEQVLAGETVKISSPERIRSLITGRKREVDASLRTRVGSSEILITIECRKRSAKQDVTWIEQLVSKKQAIGAARTIAVASSAFSSDAIRVAEHYGIDLRVLSEIDNAELQRWTLPQFVVHVYKHCDLLEAPEVIFYAEPGDDFLAISPMDGVEGGATTPDSPVFTAPDGVVLTLNDLWLRADDQLKIFDGIAKDDKVHVRRLSITPSDTLMLRTRVGERQVRRIDLTLSLRWKHERIPLADASVVSYQPASSSDLMKPQVRAEFESKDATNTIVRFGMQFQPETDLISFTLQFRPDCSIGINRGTGHDWSPSHNRRTASADFV